MGLFSSLFSGKDDSGRTEKVRERGNTVQYDHYTPTGGGGHVHENCTVDKTSGECKTYGGGEKSNDRSYNK